MARLQALFEAGHGLDDAAREALLLEQAPGDEELHKELRALWRDVTEGILDRPVARLEDGAALAFIPGQTIGGRFTIPEFIGASGMGEVYKARDERLDRIVALKVVRPIWRTGRSCGRGWSVKQDRSPASIIHTFARSTTCAGRTVNLSW
jgi:hypothetical protein